MDGEGGGGQKAWTESDSITGFVFPMVGVVESLVISDDDFIFQSINVCREWVMMKKSDKYSNSNSKNKISHNQKHTYPADIFILFVLFRFTNFFSFFNIFFFYLTLN